MIAKENIPVVVFANRKDFALTKICIASIRYYYPEVEIFLVKDKLNGDFNTRRLCRVFEVKILDLGKKYYGWSAAKIHFLINSNIAKCRYLCLDSDIIFVGKVLDKISKESGAFVLDAEFRKPPFNEEVLGLYIDPEKVKKYYPDYEYPGYFFNAGQTVVTPGLVTEELLENSFDVNTYPYYKNRDAFKLVDQAVLNAVIPVLSKRSKIEISTCNYMKWSIGFFQNGENFRFEKFKNGETEFLIHYAGDVRTHDLSKMKGADLLFNFRDHYYKRLSPFDKWADRLQDQTLANSSLTKMIYKRNRIFIEIKTRLGLK